MKGFKTDAQELYEHYQVVTSLPMLHILTTIYERDWQRFTTPELKTFVNGEVKEGSIGHYLSKLCELGILKKSKATSNTGPTNRYEVNHKKLNKYIEINHKKKITPAELLTVATIAISLIFVEFTLGIETVYILLAFSIYIGYRAFFTYFNVFAQNIAFITFYKLIKLSR